MKVFAKALHSKFAINGQLKTEIEFEYAPTFSEVYERLGFLPERFPFSLTASDHLEFRKSYSQVPRGVEFLVIYPKWSSFGPVYSFTLM